ncbi:trypco2 family protein [[Kitasatospora] papulosa]|uniref:trypco2 family protein n=1 Tax=[Kitasatospora] papulosa TaxID=1464011 RepID=UPI003682DB25
MSGHDTRSAGDNFDGIELNAAIQALHDQLVEAAAGSGGRGISFDVGDIAMEFAFEFRRETKSGGKLKAWVVEGGVDHARAVGGTHRVTFNLTARDKSTGRRSQIGNSDLGQVDDFGPSAP